MGVRETVLAAIFACIFGFLIGGSFVWSYQFPESKSQLMDSVSQHETTSAEAQKRGEEEALARYTWWLTFFTGILAIATIGLGVATAGLYLAGERQLAHLKESSERQSSDMKASNAAAEKAAAAAQSSAETAAQTLRVGSRPWVGLLGAIEVVEPLKFDTNGASIGVNFVLKNGGNSAANRSLTMSKLIVGGRLDPNAISAIQDSVANRHTLMTLTAQAGSLILPGEEFKPETSSLGVARRDFGPSEPSGNVTVWLIGRVAYRDALGDLHSTGFAQVYRATNGRDSFPSQGVVRGRFAVTGFGASAD